MHSPNVIFIVLLYFKFHFISLGTTNTSTVCYGTPGISCTSHRLSCSSPQVIQIINISYGYRPGCNDVIGLPNCANRTCCTEEPSDCFIPFSSKEEQQVSRNCSRNETCKLPGFRRYNIVDTVCNGREVSAYSKIQYDCVTTVTTTQKSPTTTGSSVTAADSTTNFPSTGPTVATTTDFTTSVPSTGFTVAAADSTTRLPSTEQEDVDLGSIVGGIIGAIIVIVLIVLVVVFIYKRKKRNVEPPPTNKEATIQTSSPHYHTIDGPISSTIQNHNTGEYDEIDLDRKPKIQTIGNHSNSSHGDNYDHIGNNLSTSPRQLETDYNHITGVLGTSNVEDDYNHIGNNYNNKVMSDDNYHHIGNDLSTSPMQLGTEYNHITGVFGTSNAEDDYNHIGNNDNKKIIIDDNYHHIRSGDIQVEGDIISD